MSALSVRTDVAEHYTRHDLMTFEYVPDSTFSPGDGALIVTPAENWITRDDDDVSFDDVVVNLELILVVEYRADNESATTQLEAALSTVIAHRPEWLALGNVTAPDLLSNGDWNHYGCRITAKTITTL